MKAKNDAILADKIAWPSPYYGDAVFKKAIHELKENCKPKANKDFWRLPSIIETHSMQELFPPIPIKPDDPDYESKIISATYDQIRNLEIAYLMRCKGDTVSFDAQKSILIFENEICQITPNDNQYYLCKYLFEKHPDGDFVDYEEVIEQGFGDDPEEVNSGIIYNAATEINKKTRYSFGFPILSTRNYMVALHRTPEAPQKKKNHRMIR